MKEYNDYIAVLRALHDLHHEAYTKGNVFQMTGPTGDQTYKFSVVSAASHAEHLPESQRYYFLGFVPGLVQAVQNDYETAKSEKGYLPKHHWSFVEMDYINLFNMMKGMDKDIASGMDPTDALKKDWMEPCQKKQVTFSSDYAYNLVLHMMSDFCEEKNKSLPKAKEPEIER